MVLHFGVNIETESGEREEEHEQGSKFDIATCERSNRLRRILSSLSNKRELSAKVFSLEAIFFSVLLSSLNCNHLWKINIFE